MQQTDSPHETPFRWTVSPAGRPARYTRADAAAEAETRCRPVSELVASLLEALRTERILYCHWKSNWRIDEWLSGKGDLDLLVARPDVDRFASVLSRLGFKKSHSPAKGELPGVINYYGYDAKLGRLIHIHAHYQLVLGHDASKNYRLPVERHVLGSVEAIDPIPMPTYEVEFAIFVVRMILKYSTGELLLRRATGKLNRLRDEIRQEYEYLYARIDRSKLAKTAGELFPTIPPTLFDECAEALAAPPSPARMSHFRRLLERSLNSQSRLRPVRERAARLLKLVSSAARTLRLVQPGRKVLESGGSLIAVLGGDGAGKSTCTDDLHRWLGKKFDTRRVHLGLPPRSMITLAVTAAIHFRRYLDRFAHAALGTPSEPFDPFDPKVDLLQRIRWLCTARDRYRLYVRIRRSASNGSIVLCDRYPTWKVKQMDGPRIEDSLNGRTPTEVERILIKMEQTYYNRISPPDQLIVLRVDPELAVRRKAKESHSHVARRSSEIWNLDWSDTFARVVDANRPRDEVIEEVRTLIWADL